VKIEDLGGELAAMADAMTTSVARHLESLFGGGSVAGLSDGQLLERFLGHPDAAGEAAFAALVARHGPMVLGVCRQLLGDHQHAEDAFQAVFLVLARRARSVRDPDLLGHWLYGVAVRTARKARVRLARRRRTEEDHAVNRPEASAGASATAPADQAAIDREQAEALHEEIDRLPASSRLPVVLCYLEGLSLAEAARRLRCPAGTVHSRLDRARARLRRGLVRRGIGLSGTALAAALAPRSASASISPLLCDTTTRAAIRFAAGQAAGGATSASATALAQEVLRSMLFYKLKLTVLTLLFLGSVATGAGLLTHSPAMKYEPGKTPAGIQLPIATKPDDAIQRPAPGRMIAVGHVLDPDGKPVTGAVVELVAQSRSPWVGASEEIFGSEHALLGQGQSDGDGRFRLDALRMGATRVFQVYALAAAPGYGLGWAKLNPDAEQAAADIRLLPEQPIRARLVDVTGAPANRVEVRVRNIARLNDQGPRASIWLWNNPPRGTRTWPRPVTTDDQGRIALTGIVRGDRVRLDVRDLRYARQDLLIDSSTAAPSGEITLALESARIIEGRVLAADTGRPIPNAVVSAETQVMNEHASGFFTAKFRADAQGRFIMNPPVGESYTLGAFATGGEPYLVPQERLEWTKGAVKAAHDIKLPRGVLIRGKVTELGTGRPLPASSIQYIPAEVQGDLLWGWQATVASRDDGSFRIAVAPGKGNVLIFGPTGDYVLGVGPAGQRSRAHAIIPYEARAGDPPHDVAAVLRPGVTVKGRVEGPDGQTITGGLILTTLHIEPFNPSWRGDFHVKVRDGRFELHGLAPDASTRIHILDPEHEWGATVDVSGKQSGEDLTIRLEPCGQARARFVGANGKPVTKLQPMFFEFVMTPGPSRFSKDKQDRGKPSADADFLADIDDKHYQWNEPRTDAEGRFTMMSLIPGALYRIIDFSTVHDDKGARIRKEFRVQPGETLDLGEILIEKP
jgi:RNA polymerase sigma factor (sigma-70 family)